MPNIPNLLDFSGVDSFDLSAIAHSMGQAQPNITDQADRHDPAPMPQVREAEAPQEIRECHMKTDNSDSLPLPTPAVSEGPPAYQGDGVLHINRPDPTPTAAPTPTPSPAPPRLLLRKMFGNPPTRTAAEWDRLAKKARKLWQQKNGIESAAACIELCYFSTAARWVMTKGKPDAVMYYHPLKEMSYPDKYKDFLEQGGGVSRYQ